MKEYTPEQIDSLIAELQAELPEILKSEAAEELAKAKIESAKEGGNGTVPVKGKMAKKADKEEESSSESSKSEKSESDMVKEESPVAAEATDEASAKAPEGSAPSEAPADAAPEAAPEGAPEEAHGSEMSLEQAYGSLSDEDLQAHYEALKAVIMAKMPQGDAGAPPAEASSAGAVPPAPEASAAPAMPGAPEGSAPPQDPAITHKSEKDSLEALSKAEDEIKGLKNQVEGITGLLEKMLAKPTQKAVTSMAEFLAKSEMEKPVTPKLSRNQVTVKLGEAAQRTDLKKSDRELINRYFMNGDVDYKSIQHLLSE